MTEKTLRAEEYFQQLCNRQNELSRKNLQALRQAAHDGNNKLVDSLRSERAKLTRNVQTLQEAELKYLGSNLAPSEAEKCLLEQARQANQLVGGIKKVTEVLGKITEMAKILTRLVTLLS
jgi:hypothetical protein